MLLVDSYVANASELPLGYPSTESHVHTIESPNAIFDILIQGRDSYQELTVPNTLQAWNI